MLGVKGERELQIRHAQRYSSHHVLTHQRLRLPILAAPRFTVIVILDPKLSQDCKSLLWLSMSTHGSRSGFAEPER